MWGQAVVKTLRTIGGKNRKFQNHPVYHRGNRKAAGWSRESWEGGTALSSSPPQAKMQLTVT